MVYKIDKEEEDFQVLGEGFVKNNFRNCKLIINTKEYDLCSVINYNEYGINKNNDSLTITLTGVNKIKDASFMFCGCHSLQSLPDISKWDTKNVKSMKYMFNGCSSLIS